MAALYSDAFVFFGATGDLAYKQIFPTLQTGFYEYSGGEGAGSIYVGGEIKVNIQWVLYWMVHNIGKIMSYGFA